MENLTELTSEYLSPTRIVAEYGVTNSEWLLKSTQDQVYFKNEGECVLSKNGYIVFDFGKELQGGLRILSSWGHNSVRVRFGESVQETYSEIKEGQGTNDHSQRDFVVLLPTLSDVELGKTGFRFVRIDNVGDNDVKLVSVFAKYIHLKVLPKGSFVCNDEKLNKIYSTACHTLFLNMQNRLWDGIKRDRLVWIGDMHPETLGILNLYGAHPLVEKGLAESAERNPVPNWISSIPSYSVWWIAILCDYVFYTGDWNYAISWLDYANGIINMLDECVSDCGELDYKNSNNIFINWESEDDPDKNSGNRGLIIWALKKYSDMLERHGLKSDLAKSIVLRLLKNKKITSKNKSVAVLYYLGYGLTEEVKELFSNNVLRGLSPFMSYYMASVILECTDCSTALNALTEFYFGMLSRGATSFWEAFDLDWLKGSGRIDELPKSGEIDIHSAFGKYCYTGYRLSLCHGWACGPINFINEYILGIKVLEEGCKTIKISPNLCGLKWCKGVFPTPYGNVKIALKEEDGQISAEIDAPKEIKIVG